MNSTVRAVIESLPAYQRSEALQIWMKLSGMPAEWQSVTLPNEYRPLCDKLAAASGCGSIRLTQLHFGQRECDVCLFADEFICAWGATIEACMQHPNIEQILKY